ncbi:arsenate reductase ArsC [Psychrobacter lutiphocae]|uniref:arsenate reductase ArsC n=1 Tax=Psychrobacter lutiphocae TaxID=540500 RepID=UPI000379BA1F|nr:arsenate reductase ArsC [Psychrobacter lutiphocae]
MNPLKILYICTHNRCRSILSEAITNQYKANIDAGNGSALVETKSAGSAPAGEVHPLTLLYLTKAGYSTQGLSSNSWDDKEYMAGFEPDVLITVCDNAAGESCPIWLGELPTLIKLHWGLADPSKNTHNNLQTKNNFEQAIAAIEHRVEQLIQVAKLPESERKPALLNLVDK